MGCKERREKEKEVMKQRILDAAMELVDKKGLGALTIRCLAEQIEYSPSMIYEYFEDKELICKELCTQICCELLNALKSVPFKTNPEEYLLGLIDANVDFLSKRPQGIELLTGVCFGSDPSQTPKEFLEAMELYTQALKGCHCKHLQTAKELEEALDVIRSLHVGMMTLSKYQTSSVELKRIGNSLENGVRALLKGWGN
ncbi:MAG: TetR/AcrR family transcriptional regulator [Rhabdochlamydiaceae bacterium]